ncbi:MFS transporter [Chitinimonas sp. PSY-7]|uniref:MFS transporter n=1 Tax=Chitinimonas sp. PSY-7 TaxID=3459088 RepID=UPI00403FE610
MQTAAIAAVTAAPRPLGASDYKTLSLAALGGSLEFYDFVIFVFFATVLGQLFFPPEIPDWLRQLQTFGIFAAGYLVRPLGGIVMAHFGDLLGRKRMFALSILMMSVPTLLMGLLPTYASIGLAAPLMLLALRIMQGAAVGGEVPGAWVFVSEHVPGRRIGFACGTLTAGLSIGILLGSFIATLANTLFTQEELYSYGWRIPFLLGGVFGICSMFLRRYLEETPVFAEMKQKKTLAAELPLKTVLREHRTGVLHSMLLTWLMSAALVVMILLTPSMLQKSFGFDAVTTLNANSAAVICLVLGNILVGFIADRFGAARTMFVGAFFLGLCSWLLYANLAAHPEWLLPLYALAGFSVGISGAIPYVMVHAFPAKVRFTGLSFSYNVAYAIFGGLTPILVGFLAKSTPLAPAYYVVAVSIVGMVTACFLPRKPAFN